MTHFHIKTVEALEAAGRVIEKYINTQDSVLIACDLETYPTSIYFPRPILMADGTYEGYVSLLSLGLNPDETDTQFLFDARELPAKELTRVLRPLLENDKVTILGQNFKYDFGFLWTQYQIWPKKFRCTQLIGKILMAGEGFQGTSLGELYAKFLDYGWFMAETNKNFYQYQQHKEELQKGDWNAELTEEQLQYGADDVRLIFFLYKRLKEELQAFIRRHSKKAVLNVIKLECSLIPHFSLMELSGIDIDIEYQRDTVIPFLEKNKKLSLERVGQHFTREEEFTAVKGGRGRKAIKETRIVPINPGSAKQVKEALEAKGIIVTGTGKEILKNLTYEHPEIQALLDYRRAAKFLSTYGVNILTPEILHSDGRVHTNFHSIGTVTGRSSSSKPLNFQNIPSRGKLFGEDAGAYMRKAYIAGKGYKFICKDYSQIEPRYIAQYTGEPGLVNELLKGKKADLHAQTGMLMLDLDYLPQKGDYARDYIGKTLNLALLYGMGAYKLAKTIYLESDGKICWSVDEAQDMIDKFFSLYPSLLEYMKKQEYVVRKSFEPYDSLAAFRNRKPMFTEFTATGRPESWYLMDYQETLCKTNPEALRKNFIQMKEDKETGRLFRTQNNYDRRVSTIARESYNFRIQGTCADILKVANLRVSEALLEAGFDPINERIVNVVHDEILVRVREERAEEAEAIIDREMVAAGELYIKKVPVLIDGGISDSWAEAKSA